MTPKAHKKPKEKELKIFMLVYFIENFPSLM